MPADDAERTQKFYKEIFKGDRQKWSNPENPEKDYWYIETKDDNGNARIRGWRMECQSPYRKVINYIIVSSVDEYISKIEKAGGKIIISKTDIPNRNLCNIFWKWK